MKLIDFINDLNANGKLEYNDYSQLHDLASDLKAENAELKDKLEEFKDLQAVINYRRDKDIYYQAYVKEWQKREKIRLGIPDAYTVYKDYAELKARLEKAVELPLKIGDTVWLVYTKNQREPAEFKVADIQITLQHFKVYVMGTEDGGWLNYTVFLNKEQAEARLKELKGEK